MSLLIDTAPAFEADRPPMSRQPRPFPVPESETRRSVLNIVEALELDDVMGFDDVFGRIKGMPWATHTLQHLHRVLSARKARMPRYEGEELDAYVCRLVEDLGAEPEEAMHELPKGTVVVYDLKGYSLFQNHIGPMARRKQDQAFQEYGKRICDSYGVSLLQAPAGDKLMFYLPDSDEGSSHSLRVLQLLKALMETHVSTGMSEREIAQLGLDPALYPNGEFTASIGAASVAEKELYATTVMGPPSHDQGVTMLLGAAYVRALNAQERAGGNQVVLDEALQTKLESRFLSWGTSKKKAEVPALNGIVDLPSLPVSRRVGDVALPEDPVLRRALMLSAGQSLHQRGSFSEFSAQMRERLQRAASLNSMSNRLGPTTLFLVLGEREDLGLRPEHFVKALNLAVKLLNKAEYKSLHFAKTDEQFLVLQTNEDPVDIYPVLQRFLKEFDDGLRTMVNPLPLNAVGIASDKMMTTTTYEVFDGAFARDGASPGYVEAARLAKEEGVDLPRVRWAFSFTQRAQIPGEHSQVPTKGGVILMLGSDPQEAELRYRELVELGEARAQLQQSLAELKKANLIGVKPKLTERNLNDSEKDHIFHLGGFGVSALLRDLERAQLGSMQRLEPLGNGSLPVTRALIVQLERRRFLQKSDPTLTEVPDFDVQYLAKGEAALQNEMDRLLAQNLEWLSEPLIFLLDQLDVSEGDRYNLQRFFDGVRGREVGLIHTLNLSFDREGESVMVPEKTAAGLRDIIFSQRPDLSQEEKQQHSEAVEAAVAEWIQKHAQFPRTPRLAFQLARAMAFEGAHVHLPSPDEISLGVREAGVRIESALHSPQTRKVLSFLAYIGAYLPFETVQDLVHEFADIGPVQFSTALVDLEEGYFIRRNSEGDLKIASNDLLHSAKLLFDEFLDLGFQERLANRLLSLMPAIDLTEGLSAEQLYNAHARWEQEMRLSVATPAGLALGRGLAEYYYRKGNIKAALSVYGHFFQKFEFSALPSNPDFYLSVAKVFAESSIPDYRKKAAEIYDKFLNESEPKAESHKLEALWYRMGRLPVLDSNLIPGEGQDLIQHLSEYVNAFDGLSSESEDPSFQSIKRAFEVEMLYRKCMAARETKSPLVPHLQSLNKIKEELSLVSVASLSLAAKEAHLAAQRLMGGLMKVFGDVESDPTKQLDYYLESAQILGPMAEAFRALERPDFEQAREAVIGRHFALGYYFHMKFSNSNPTTLESEKTGLLASLRAIQEEVLEELNAFMVQGADFNQRNRLLTTFENAIFLELYLRRKCRDIDFDFESFSTVKVGAYLWARNQRNRLPLKVLAGEPRLMQDLVDSYIATHLPECSFDKTNSRRPQSGDLTNL